MYYFGKNRNFELILLYIALQILKKTQQLRFYQIIFCFRHLTPYTVIDSKPTTERLLFIFNRQSTLLFCQQAAIIAK
jgi:hypothetical protein